MTRRLTIVLDESVTESGCGSCRWSFRPPSVGTRTPRTHCRVFGILDGSRSPECLEAERAAARMVDPTEALLHLADVSERLDLDAMNDQESNWRALHVAAAIEALTGGTDTPTTLRVRR